MTTGAGLDSHVVLRVWGFMFRVQGEFKLSLLRWGGELEDELMR